VLVPLHRFVFLAFGTCGLVDFTLIGTQVNEILM
jgi:hypothetical protein